MSWPVIYLLVGAYAAMGTATTLCLLGAIPLWTGTLVNALSIYVLFTPAHESMHRNVSHHKRLNEWVMYIATFIAIPFGTGQFMRIMHMQHHRFTNESNDPDHFLSSHFWTMPLWGFWPFIYLFQYIANPSKYPGINPWGTLREVVVGFGIVIGLFVTSPWLMLWLWLVPIYVGFFLMCVVFMVLPHYPARIKASEDPYKATVIRKGHEWLLNSILMYQNYHLVHHLYPTIPFNRYIKAWNAELEFHEVQEPTIIEAFSKNR